jgi:hypothetical protein
MATAIEAPYPMFFTASGVPIEGGRVYIGVAGLNPLANPQTAYWDEALTIPAYEIQVSGGYMRYNGAPGRVYVPGDYSILVQDKYGATVYSRLSHNVSYADLFMTEARGTLTRSMRTPLSFNFDLILESGRYGWTNAATANQPAVCGAADLFALDVYASPDGAGIVYQRLADLSLTFDVLRYSFERKSIDAGATWSAWEYIGNDFVVVSGPATPYTIVSQHPNTTVLVTTGAGAFVVNLPIAGDVIGNTIKIVKIDSGAGAIQIVPNGADVIANAGNVSIYIGKQYRHVTLQSQAAGGWIVIAGSFEPSHGVDTNGSQITLSKLNLLPNTNVAARAFLNAGVTPAAGAWSAAYNLTGNYGVPAGAKAVLVKATGIIVRNASAGAILILAFSDNNANVPSETTSHAIARWYSSINTPTSTVAAMATELIVPLNSSGQLYLYTIGKTAALDVEQITLAVRGYYMGD